MLMICRLWAQDIRLNTGHSIVVGKGLLNKVGKVESEAYPK